MNAPPCQSLDDYLAHVDADAELDTAIFGHLGIAIGQASWISMA